MPSVRYTHVRYPWKAVVGRNSEAPSRYYVSLAVQAHRNGLPASRSFGRAQSFLAHRDLPEVALARLLRFFPARRAAELDAALEELLSGWGALVERGSRLGLSLPATLSDPSLLVLERASARTWFVFDHGDVPLLVLKQAREGHPGVAREIRALRTVGPLGIGPRYLGTVDTLEVQEALHGRVQEVASLMDPARLQPAPGHVELGRVLVRLGAGAVASGRPKELAVAAVAQAASHDLYSSRTRAAVARALEDVSSIGIRVLKHTDVSPQNCIVDGEGLVGLVDWEISTFEGMPGFDSLNAALAYLEHCLGLDRWSHPELIEAFAAAWSSSLYFDHWRAVTSDCLEAAGLSTHHLESLIVSFFAWRVGLRIERPGAFPYGEETAVRMLEIVCGS